MRHYPFVAALVISALVAANQNTVIQEVVNFREALANELTTMRDAVSLINQKEDRLFHIDDEPLERKP